MVKECRYEIPIYVYNLCQKKLLYLQLYFLFWKYRDESISYSQLATYADTFLNHPALSSLDRALNFLLSHGIVCRVGGESKERMKFKLVIL